MNDLAKNLLLWVIVAVVLLAVFQSFSTGRSDAAQEVAYSSFLDEVHTDAIKSVQFGSDTQGNVSTLNFERKNGSKGTTTAPYDRDLINDLTRHKVDFAQEKPSSGPSILY